MSGWEAGAIEADAVWCDKGEGKVRIRVLRLQRNGRVAFERLTGPMNARGKEVRCDVDQFLTAYRPEAHNGGTR